MNGKYWMKWAGISLVMLLGAIVNIQAQPMLPPLPPGQVLNIWRFEDTNWLASFSARPPRSFTNIDNVPAWDGNALQVDSFAPAWLNYNLVETNSRVNLTLDKGTISFWFLPNWESTNVDGGTGPGDVAQLLDVGALTSDAAVGWWSLYVNSSGTSLYFSGQTNGAGGDYLNFPISWDSSTWHLIVLTYTATNSVLYLDGQIATNGSGVAYLPGPAVATNGFFLGSDYAGNNQAHGQFDILRTYNYPQDADTVADYYAGLAPELPNPGGFHTFSAPFPGGTNSGGTNTYYGNFVTNTPPDYGTNLWLSITSISNVWVNLVLSNTLADVLYEIQGNTNLVTTNWVHEGFVFGSELTNWTPTSIAAFTRTINLFLRVRSWTDDGSGLPVWWQLQYFGYVGVDPNGDPTGDGWSNIQKFQQGWNPNVFYTPPTPQGLTAALKTNGIASITWLPSPGSVTSYTFKRHDWLTGAEDTLTLSANTNNYTDNLSGDTLEYSDFGPQLLADYALSANYGTNGSSAFAGASIFQNPAYSGNLITGPQGRLYFLLSSPPSDLSFVRIYRQDNGMLATGSDDDYVYNSYGVYSPLTDGYFEIPASQITNGLCPLPDSQMTPFFTYNLWVQTVRSNAISSQWAGPFYNVANTPFADARVQLKDNLRFILRATGTAGPFAYYNDDNDGQVFDFPTNYSFAGFYSSALCGYRYAETYYNQNFDALRPVYDNCFYRNFVYDQSHLDTNGFLNTGCYYGGYVIGHNYASELAIHNTATYFFDIADYLVSTNPVLPASLLTASQSTWIIPQRPAGNASPGELNYNHLPFVSEEGNFITNHTLYPVTVYPGDSASGLSWLYWQIAQPVFQTNGYYFARFGTDPIPEQSGFALTNTTRQMYVPVGGSLKIAGYAKLTVSNTPCYLGQYFDQAYKVDNSGNVTTNTTGVLSPYGDFFATEPGQTALVTMPDIDTGARGTCMVYAVSLQLDANHDGIMDGSFSGPDATSFAKAMQFWVNDNYDRSYYDSDDKTNYEDDVLPEGTHFTPFFTPDCKYTDQFGYRTIPTKRDLEDFTRLWISGVTTNLLAHLPLGSSVTLSWGSTSADNPTIDLFAAAETNGGTGYLTNETVATQQTNISTSPYLGRLGPGQSIQLNTIVNTLPTTHFIWCGVSNGTGGLTLTISDALGNILVQTTTYIQIQDIKQMYERWTLGDALSKSPGNVATIAGNDLDTSAIELPFKYSPPTDTNTPYILYVHGWNMSQWDKDRFAETALKRLYWQGYQGRFGVFRWPTGYGFIGLSTVVFNPTEKDNFDSSEYNSWKSAAGLLNKLKDLNAEYPGQVYVVAHSMGNVITGEALRLAGTTNVVNTYVASQAAITAHTYDTNVPNYSFSYPPWSSSAATPNIYGNFFVGNVGGGAGKIMSFYNTNDFALQRSSWQRNELLKPDQDVVENGLTWNYNYSGYTNDPAPWNHFSKVNLFLSIGVTFDIVNVLTNRYEVMAYAAQPYTTALGATPGVLNLNRNVELTRTSPSRIWPSDPAGNNYTEHFYHSAQFRGDNPQMQGYWSELLGSEAFNLK